MALGIWLHLKEHHTHMHDHEALEHAHAHSHDAHLSTIRMTNTPRLVPIRTCIDMNP